jgi:TRAP-type C4-dicarboxylate transport system permease small subunit
MTRSVKALLIVSCCLLFAALLLVTYYNSVGSYVDENGWLIEEFWALGLGSFALILGLFGIFLSVVVLVVQKIRKRKVT